MSEFMLESPAEAERAKKEAYEKWLAKPEIKMMISLLPPLDTDIHRECFSTILRSGYDAGHDAGEGHSAGRMLAAMLKHKDKRDDR